MKPSRPGASSAPAKIAPIRYDSSPNDDRTLLLEGPGSLKTAYGRFYVIGKPAAPMRCMAMLKYEQGWR